jgi:hypothetical protein
VPGSRAGSWPAVAALGRRRGTGIERMRAVQWVPVRSDRRTEAAEVLDPLGSVMVDPAQTLKRTSIERDRVVVVGRDVIDHFGWRDHASG